MLGRPHDSDLLIPAIIAHRTKLGRIPRLLATDAAFYSARNEAAAKTMGVKRVCIRNRASKSPERKREQRKRWFRNRPEMAHRMRGAHQRRFDNREQLNWKRGCQGVTVTRS